MVICLITNINLFHLFEGLVKIFMIKQDLSYYCFNVILLQKVFKLRLKRQFFLEKAEYIDVKKCFNI